MHLIQLKHTLVLWLAPIESGQSHRTFGRNYAKTSGARLDRLDGKASPGGVIEGRFCYRDLRAISYTRLLKRPNWKSVQKTRQRKQDMCRARQTHLKFKRRGRAYVHACVVLAKLFQPQSISIADGGETMVRGLVQPDSCLAERRAAQRKPQSCSAGLVFRKNSLEQLSLVNQTNTRPCGLRSSGYNPRRFTGGSAAAWKR